MQHNQTNIQFQFLLKSDSDIYYDGTSDRARATTKRVTGDTGGSQPLAEPRCVTLLATNVFEAHIINSTLGTRGNSLAKSGRPNECEVRSERRERRTSRSSGFSKRVASGTQGK